MEPVVISDDTELQQTLAEISRLKSFEQKVEADLKTKLEDVKQMAAKRLIQDGTPIAERLAACEAAVAVYCTEHRGRLLKPGAKSRQFASATVSWRVQPAMVTYQEGQDSRTVTAHLVTSLGLVQRVLAWLGGLCVFSRGRSSVYASSLLELKPSLSLTKIGQAYQAGQLKLADLEQLGLTIEPEREAFTVKPHDRPLGEENPADFVSAGTS
jgi:phage host-nuclease inhibitor protein Gam